MNDETILRRLRELRMAVEAERNMELSAAATMREAPGYLSDYVRRRDCRAGRLGMLTHYLKDAEKWAGA